METNMNNLTQTSGMRPANWPHKTGSQQISTREMFLVALAQVNTLVRREDISVEDAKDTLTKAEALRAWAAFDRKLSEDEKKDANRAMTRTVIMLAKVAEREQPISYDAPKRKGAVRKLPGPQVWLQRELGISKAKASFMRRLLASEDRAREIISMGVHWYTALGVKMKDNGATPLARMGAYTKNSNSLMCAMRVAPHLISKELTRIRGIKAWCDAYETALLKIKARGKSETISDRN